MDEENICIQGEFSINGFKDAATYSQKTLQSVLAATKSSNELPSAGDEFDYYSTFQGVRTFLLQKRQGILSLMTSLIQSQGIRDKFEGRELEEKFDLLIDVNDVILESVSSHLDEVTGLKKSEEELMIAVKPVSAINTSWNKKQFSSSSPQSLKLLTAKNITRPQLTFKDKVDNSNSLFVPVLKDKPNSIKPLAIILEKVGDKEEFCHPYECEIEKFSPNDELMKPVEATPPLPLEKTPLKMIKTEKELKMLCSELKQQKEFAVDLEHHSYRSFQGFTCLMQISTREKDYIVDVLELRSELHILNEVFTDPKIVKVLHGADMDILWLQHDFGIYVVNLFDTGQAARVLQFAHLSLSYLVKHFCHLELDKTFQLADWRIRPLPDKMIAYARQDTHYLLYVYDCLKNDLIRNGNETNNLLVSAFDRSKMICLKKYQNPLFGEDKYLELYKKSKKVFNAKQLYCLKELYSWRDRIARENDESLPYVLPNHMLLQIAEALPREQQGILACCNPIPPLVKQSLNELNSIVLRANESSQRQVEMQVLQEQAQSHKVNNTVDLGNLVHCPHDILHLEDKRSQSANESYNSGTSLPLVSREHFSPSISRKRPALTALFERPAKKRKTSKVVELSEVVNACIKRLISPFERYKITAGLHSSEGKEKELPTDQSIQVEKRPSCRDANSSHSPKQSSESTTLNKAINIDGVPQENSLVNDSSPNSNVDGGPKENSLVNESSPNYESVSLRQKTRKKKKKKTVEPDISIIVPPPKKPPSPEVITIEDNSFTPYDYSQTDHTVFQKKEKFKEVRKHERSAHAQSQPGGKAFRKNRKHFKQATFSGESTSGTKKNLSRWPQNK